MGLSSKKQTTKPIVSDWMGPKLERYSSGVDNFLNGDPSQFVAPASALQNQAFAGTQALGGWETGIGRAADMAGQAGSQGPATAQAYLADSHSLFDNGGPQRYMDPALDSYVTPALAAFDATEGRQLASLQANAARSGAFGGSRHGVALGDFLSQSGVARAEVEANLRRSAYSQGLEAAQREADRRQQTAMHNAGQQTNVSTANANLLEQSYLRSLQSAGLLGDLANTYGANQRADLGLTAELGTLQRGIDSEYRNALPTQLQMAGNLYRAIPPEAYIGQKTKSSGGALAQILGTGAQAAAAYFSDRRLKDDVVRIGSSGELGIYRYRFKGEDMPRTGVMADEVAAHAPHALGPMVGGYATVDYAKLGLSHLVEG